MDYSEYSTVTSLLDKSQEADKDNRERGRESEHFIHTPDGQWEPEITRRFAKKPRYTFDFCSQYIDDIAGEIENAEFSLRALPAGGGAAEDVAEIYDGMMRHIQNESDATDMYSDCGRKTLESGFSGWRVVQDYENGDTFEQRLKIVEIKNPLDNLWFDHDSRDRTHKGARHGFVLKPLARDAYEQKYPKGSGQGLGQDRYAHARDGGTDDVVIGEIVYAKDEPQEIVLLSNGNTYVVDDEFQKVWDELSESGVVEVSRRTRTIKRWYSRLFDGSDFLGGEQKTVFTGRIPLIPCYGNFAVVEDQVTWYSAIEKKKDAARVNNYAQSRKVEESILSPRPKPWVTRDMLSNDKDRKDAETLNTNNKPVQTYTADPNAPQGPTMPGIAPVNPGLEQVTNDMRMFLTPADQRMPGQALGLRSGTAVQMEQDAEDTKNQKWFSTLQRSIRATGEVLVNAIPEVYDTRRQVQVLGEDGVSDTVTINDSLRDQDTGEVVELNPVNRGRYSVICQAGPQFKNRQQAAVQSFIEMAAQDPTILDIARDLMLKNTNAPGMDIAAKRMRAMMIAQGKVHPDEFTDEERAMMEQQQAAAAQNQQPDAMTIAALAEDKKAENQRMELQLKAAAEETKRMQAETDRMKAQSDAEVQRLKIELETAKAEAERNKNNAAAAQGFAKAHETMGKSGVASPESAEGGVRAYEEVINDHLKQYVYDPTTDTLQ